MKALFIILTIHLSFVVTSCKKSKENESELSVTQSKSSKEKSIELPFTFSGSDIINTKLKFWSPNPELKIDNKIEIVEENSTFWRDVIFDSTNQLKKSELGKATGGYSCFDIVFTDIMFYLRESKVIKMSAICFDNECNFMYRGEESIYEIRSNPELSEKIRKRLKFNIHKTKINLKKCCNDF